MTELFAAAEIGDQLVCRKCMTMEETISAVRGFSDTLSNDAVSEAEYTCSRCNNQIFPFHP